MRNYDYTLKKMYEETGIPICQLAELRKKLKIGKTLDAHSYELLKTTALDVERKCGRCSLVNINYYLRMKGYEYE